MRRLWIPLLLLGGCASGATELEGPRAAAPGEPVVVHPREFPAEITGRLSAADADSCGVCEREKRAEAFELAALWFAPGHRVRVDDQRGWRRLAGGEQELYFGPADESAPRLSFRFHTVDDHLVGIAEADFTDSRLAARVLARPPGAVGDETLEIVAFDYGDGESFLFDEAANRLQVQCRILEPETPEFGGPLRGEGDR